MKKLKWISIISLFFIVLSVNINVDAQSFRSIVEARLKRDRSPALARLCPIDTDVVAERVFRDYGAIYVSNVGAGPPKCVFENESEVQAFQSATPSETRSIGGVSVTLQSAAMKDLLAAVQEAGRKGLAITPRGGSEASTRSYERTAELWNSRFEPGLRHWVANGSIKRADADRVRRMPIHDQVAAVLEWEKRRLYFSTDLSKSILYSVAAPGASQHIFMLALDVSQFSSGEVRRILARHGWFQTVKSDLPHFTYLGRQKDELSSLGLRLVMVGDQEFWIPDMN